MLLTLFGILLGLGVILAFLGYYAREGSYSLIGFSFMFILAIWTLLPGNLEYASGQTETYNYICQACDGSSFPTTAGANSTALLSSKVTVNDYTKISDATTRFFGIWLALVAIAGFTTTLVEMRKAV